MTEHAGEKEQPCVPPRPLGWWTISGEALLDLLRQAHGGADPGLLYAEHYANSEVTDHG